MNILTFSEARAGREAVMDDVCNDHSPTIITRQGGEAVVMLSLADFNSIELHWNEKPESWQPM